MKRILIVEDNLLIAEDIKLIIEDLNYKVVDTVIKAEQAIEVLKKETIDLVLIDIVLKGEMSGIELAHIINTNFKVPFIYLTSHSDPKTVEKAIKTQPNGYIVKPFNQSDLFTSISLAFNASKENTETLSFSNKLKEYCFFKVDGIHKKIIFSDIKYIRSTGNYIEVYTLSSQYLIRATFKEIAVSLPDSVFLQIHRSYIINIHNITGYTSNFVEFNDTTINVGKKFLESFSKVKESL
ncbi:MAG: response regulator [Polaribacter sp.]|uniref:response regulator n=1 Tax=Polaribacter sp. TaxID=1920175 RepID=UPI002F36126D